MQGNNVTFEGCRFGPMSGLPLKLTSCYSYNCWCEGIGCTNVVVRNCRFDNCLAATSWNSIPDLPQIQVTMKIPPDYWPMRNRPPITHPGFAREVEANLAAGRKVAPSLSAIRDILVAGNTFVNPRGVLRRVENASRVTFRDNKVEFNGTVWDRKPYAGKIRIDGGSDIDVPPDLVERNVGKERK